MSVLVAATISFLITVFGMPVLIRYFRNNRGGQMIREEGPTWHENKTGTPTMGGLLFISAMLIASVVSGTLAGWMTPVLLTLLFILILYGLLGMWDDSIKLFRRQNEGLKAWQKLVGQISGAIIFTMVFIHEQLPLVVHIPDIGDLHLGFLYVLFVMVWLVGFSNAVNLTDGLDGLVAGLATITFGAYGLLAFHQHQFDVMIFCSSIVGGLMGFFIYNHKPAKIFMGDMGSLALGGSLAAVSIMLHHALSLLWIGFIFVFETTSVILQVTFFKLTGKRLLLMSPIHHHFEMKGWSEWQVNGIFWMIGLITAITGVLFMW